MASPRGLDRSCRALRRWRLFRRHDGAPCAAAAARRHSRPQNRRGHGVQGRSADAVAAGLRQDRPRSSTPRASPSSRSLKPSIRPAAWGGSRSTCCCPSRNSSARSPGSESATRSPPRRREACGWADSPRSATTSRNASSTSTKRKPRPFAIYSSVISSSALCREGFRRQSVWRPEILARGALSDVAEPDLSGRDCPQGQSVPRGTRGHRRRGTLAKGAKPSS